MTVLGRLRSSGFRGLLVVAMIAPALVVLAPPAGALVPDPQLEQGTPVAANPAGPPGYLELRAVGPQYVAYRLEQEDEYDADPHLLVRRLSDGAAVRTLTWTEESQEPWLSDDAYLVVSPLDGGGRRVVVRGVEAGEHRWTVDVPASERFVAGGASWVLSAQNPDGQNLDGAGQAVLRRPGADPVQVPGVTLSQPGSSGPRAVADARTVVVHDGGRNRIWSLDLETAVATELTDTSEGSDRVLLTPHRIFWIDEYAIGARSLNWADRDDHTVHSVLLPDGHVDSYLAFGDRVAALTHGAEPDRANLEPIDLVTGLRSAPVAADVAAARSLGDGRVALVLADTATGRLVTLADDGEPAREVVTLPAIARRIGRLGITGGRVVADFGSAYEDDRGEVMVAPDSPGGSWSGAPADGDDPMPGALVEARGGTVLTRSTTGLRLSWPGGHRDLTGPGRVELQRGGTVLLRTLDTGERVAEEVGSGAALSVVPAGEPAAVDGRTLYRGPDAQGVLTVTDLDGAVPQRRVQLGVDGCPDQDLEVAGRFALVRCGDRFTVAALHGEPVTLPLPEPPDRVVDPLLGDGFVVWARYLTDPDGVDYAVAVVQDLGPGRAVRSYGPLHGRYSLPFILLAVDDHDPRFAYADTRLLPRTAELDWLSQAPQVARDSLAPTLTSITGTPRVTGTTVSVAWSYTDTTDVVGADPAGIESYDVRYAQRAVGSAALDWQQPAELRRTTITQTQLTAVAGQDTCWSVRARDAAGNVSPWSPVRCSAVDGTAPVLGTLSGSPRLSGSTKVDFAWSFTDPALAPDVPGSGVASYDVRYRQSPRPAAAYGAWVRPAAWQNTTKTGVTLTAGAGTSTCFQVRARDRAGTLSPWSGSRCSLVDHKPPVITKASPGSLLVPRTTSTTVRFAYRAKDDTAVRGYDVRYRTAAPGRRLGSATSPAGWRDTSATTRELKVGPGSQACFGVRARDRVGNVSAWSSWKCVLVPRDDRRLKAGGSVTRTTSRLALSGTVSRLDRKGATLRAGHQTGRAISVSVIQGPRRGKVAVYVGSRRVGVLQLRADTTRRRWLTVSTKPFADATITFKSLGGGQSHVDAWAVRR